jgi:hypothetical protein
LYELIKVGENTYYIAEAFYAFLNLSTCKSHFFSVEMSFKH